MALFVNTPGARRSLHAQEVALLFSSLMIMCVCIIGLRVVFAVPLALQANWIFRTTQVSPIARYMAAIRTPLFALAVAPVWLASAVFFLASWPWQMAVGHLVLLGLWGVGLAWLCLHGFGKIPFTCSWLPGKLSIHMAFLAALGMLLLMARAAVYERLALADPLLYAGITAGLAITCLILRWRTVAVATSDEQIVQFEELPAPALQGLGLHHDGILPIARGSGP